VPDAITTAPAPTVRLGCGWCGAERGLDLDPWCQSCGGSLEVRDERLDVSTWPVGSLWDYADVLPVAQRVSLGEGATPLLRLDRLLRHDDVWAKAEWTNPTGSFKDRGVAVAVSAALELGAEGVVCASTGNNAASVSAYAARAGLPCLVILPAGTPRAKVFQALVHGATIVEVEGSFSDAYRVALDVQSADAGFANLTSTFLNPYMTAAHATIAYELRAQLGRDVGSVVVPIGAGPMLVGIIDGFARLVRAGASQRAPMPIGVQAAGCAPIAKAFAAGAEEVRSWDAEIDSCAGSINDPLIGYAADGTRTLRAVRAAGGEVRAVDDGSIQAALRDLGGVEGIGCEPAAASALACFRGMDQARALPRPVVLVLSGHALKDIGAAGVEAHTLRAGPTPDVNALIAGARRRHARPR
jgi:threonine synthase